MSEKVTLPPAQADTGGWTDMSDEFPEVRVRQPAFTILTENAGLRSVDSLLHFLDVDLHEVQAAVRGDPVSPDFVASVLIAFPEQTFRDLFQLDLHCTHAWS